MVEVWRLRDEYTCDPKFNAMFFVFCQPFFEAGPRSLQPLVRKPPPHFDITIEEKEAGLVAMNRPQPRRRSQLTRCLLPGLFERVRQGNAAVEVVDQLLVAAAVAFRTFRVPKPAKVCGRFSRHERWLSGPGIAGMRGSMEVIYIILFLSAKAP